VTVVRLGVDPECRDDLHDRHLFRWDGELAAVGEPLRNQGVVFLLGFREVEATEVDPFPVDLDEALGGGLVVTERRGVGGTWHVPHS
jgi:hypothetical protein